MKLIIPAPNQISFKEGFFQLRDEMKLYFDAPVRSLIPDFQNWVRSFSNFSIRYVNQINPHPEIIITKLENKGDEQQEAYILQISPNGIQIKGFSLAGVFYGLQSLKQLIYKANIAEKTRIPCLQIYDTPRFQWRGFMLDVARHYQPVPTIKSLIDVMALLKMNKFHFHFNDDQGWRIPINKYPKLVDVGSKRKDSKMGGFKLGLFRGEAHEGVYSQAEIREIVQYAKNRFIEIIPEIEIPGHCSAVIASYPHLSCTEKKIEVQTNTGVFSDIYCAGKESTFEFLKDIIDEMTDLFPSEIVHIGGDEAPKKGWKKCPACKLRMMNENITNVDELQLYFTNRIGTYLASKGKRLMGWNQIMGNGLQQDALIQYWIGKKKVMLDLLRCGYQFVMSDWWSSYLDYNYLAIPMRKMYFYEPIPSELEPRYHKNILGIEAPLWTEWVPNLNRLGWQVFPRLLAIAEAGWTQKKNKDYQDFLSRTPDFFKYLDEISMPHARMEEVDPSKLYRFLRFFKWLTWPVI